MYSVYSALEQYIKCEDLEELPMKLLLASDDKRLARFGMQNALEREVSPR
jgi:hypothetical protein